MRPIEIDGSTGEGGGQLLRNAIALAAATCLPVKIVNVRANRPSSRGGGLKSQHVTAIACLAKATDAKVKGLEIGSKTLEFRPSSGPDGPFERNIQIHAESPAASALLIFQALFPFLLLAANEANDPIELVISGGTNVSFSLSYEYLDQVFLPTLKDWFGIHVERSLRSRGWSSGSVSRGSLWFKIQPLVSGTTLKPRSNLPGTLKEDYVVESVEATIITPSGMHGELLRALRKDLLERLPDAGFKFRQAEESHHDSRIYVLLVAKSQTLLWGRDILYTKKRTGKTMQTLASEVSKTVTKALCDEIQRAGVVDEFLQDQLVIFQALAEGKTSFPRRNAQGQEDRFRPCDGTANKAGLEPDNLSPDVDKVRGPLGEPEFDSTHAMTARWVASEILEPKVKWYNQGTICEGIGLVSGRGKGPL